MLANARQIVYPPRSCSKADGRPKTGYPTRRAALHSRKAHRRRDLHAYTCPVCGLFHLGSRTPQA